MDNTNLKYANMPHRVILIEGLDRLGKSTLIENIQQLFGYYQVIHMSKPKLLYVYGGGANESATNNAKAQQHYQRECFINMMHLMKSEAHIIFDRSHLGESVYAPLYRKYDGDYVFALEKAMGVTDIDNVHLVLLTEDFACSKHFVDDGLSFDITKRKDEQQMFIDAFNRSRIASKRIVCVTDPSTGNFRDQLDIVRDALI